MFKVEIKLADNKNRSGDNLFETTATRYSADSGLNIVRQIERIPGRKAWKITDHDETTFAIISIFLIGQSKHGGFVVIKEDHGELRTKMRNRDFNELLDQFNQRYSAASTAVNTSDLLWL